MDPNPCSEDPPSAGSFSVRRERRALPPSGPAGDGLLLSPYPASGSPSGNAARHGKERRADRAGTNEPTESGSPPGVAERHAPRRTAQAVGRGSGGVSAGGGAPFR